MPADTPQDATDSGEVTDAEDQNPTADTVNEAAESSKDGHVSMSVSAVVTLLIGVVLVLVSFKFFGYSDGTGESTVFELIAALIGLAFLAPGLLLIFSSLFGIKKSGEADIPVDSDNAESSMMKLGKGCGVIALIILVGLVGVVKLLSNAISG